MPLLLMFFNATAPVAAGYPAIFQAWNGVENRTAADELENLALHDLAFAHPYALLRISWDISESQPYAGLATGLNPQQLAAASERRAELRALNPRLRLLVEIRYRDAKYLSRENETRVENWWEVGFYPPNSPYWLKNEEDAPVIGWGEDTNGDGKIDASDTTLHFLIDFTHPEVQDLVVAKAVALDASGLFDGIMFDWWNEDSATSPIGPNDWSATILTQEAEFAARVSLLQKIRAAVSDDFLILVNANTRQIPKSARYVNGIFMECYKSEHGRGYTLEEILAMEETLLWAETHLREPRINCLEGWRVVTDYTPDRKTRIAERRTEVNLQWMRLITTLSLTHSDGYVLFADDNAVPLPDHLHNWYDFWDAELGEPIGEKGQRYQGREGLFVREFTNGWAVYNRSGTSQKVAFTLETLGVKSGKQRRQHEVANMDGEIFLKTDIGDTN